MKKTMPKFLKSIFLISIFLSLFPAFVLAEDITITTYYPSPYGSYQELRGKRIAIGDNYINGASYTWEVSDGDGGEVDYLADLIVEGNVGIGTATPTTKLTLPSGEIGIGQQNDSTPYLRLGMDTGYIQYLANNAYWTGAAYNYVSPTGYSGTATAIRQVSGTISFDTSSGGTNPITWNRRLYIDNSGRVTEPAQPAFAASYSGAISAGATVVWGNVINNVGNCYNATTGAFTAPVTGMYLFGFNILLPNAGVGEWRVAFYKNSANYNQIILYKDTQPTWQTIQGTTMIYLAAGDIVTIYYVSGAGALYNDANFNRFWGYLLG